jgi:small conductance mechanosensitive channel
MWMNRRFWSINPALVGLIAAFALFGAGTVAAQQADPSASPSSELLPGVDLAKSKPAESEKSAAEKRAEEETPFRVPTIGDLRVWVREHGLTVLAIVAVITVILWLAGRMQGRIVKLLARGDERGQSVEREARARTLVGVLNNALRTAAITVGAIMILDEFAVPIGPLLGGVAVVGLAVAFGAQSLIKDYFTGFMVLLEQQYVLGDVIKIGEISGQVENITLRLTVLRDFEGRVHFIPHGQITTVTNMTHGWSRAVIDIGVAYDEDPDRVIGVLLDLARELRADPQFGPLILEDASMLGVDTLGDSSVVIKFGIKTRPAKQWEVKREMLRRIKRRFAELGIEIPYPQRTVRVRGEGSGFGVQGSEGKGRGGEANDQAPGSIDQTHPKSEIPNPK